MTDGDLKDARARFFRGFGESTGAHSVRIDYTPLHIADAGFAAELFPAARFILTRRDPVAACLSASLHGKELTATAANLLRFPDAAILASIVAESWTGVKEALAPRTLVVEHAEILGQPRETLARVLEFLGLGGAAAGEAVTALAENPDIPVGDWRRYEALLPADTLDRLSKVAL